MVSPRISVIVPVYKVEPYLRKCLDSIVRQTYQNLEIILVDDGSPDRCGEICDEYAGKDDRIRVIHKENGGVSAARNTALDMASGEWIGFADSDDWLEPDMYQYLLDGAVKNHAQIAVCGRFEHYPQKTVEVLSEQSVISAGEALGLLLNDSKIKSYSWDKLFRRELFDSLRYPVGVVFEDIRLLPHLFERAESVAILPAAKYHYLRRGSGITNSQSLGDKICRYHAMRATLDSFGDRCPEYRLLLQARCLMAAVGVWASVYANPKKVKKAHDEELREIALFAKGNYSKTKDYLVQNFTGIKRLYLPAIWLTQFKTRWSFAILYAADFAFCLLRGRHL